VWREFLGQDIHLPIRVLPHAELEEAAADLAAVCLFSFPVCPDKLFYPGSTGYPGPLLRGFICVNCFTGRQRSSIFTGETRSFPLPGCPGLGGIRDKQGSGLIIWGFVVHYRLIAEGDHWGYDSNIFKVEYADSDFLPGK